MPELRPRRVPVTGFARVCRIPALCAEILAAAGAFVGCSGASPRAPQPVRPMPPAAALLRYEVTVAPDLTLGVDASFEGTVGGALVVDEPAEPFVEGLEIQTAGGFVAVPRMDTRWAARCASPCRVRYRFRLPEAAAALRDADVALPVDGGVVAPPSTWLVRPSDNPGGRYRFHVVSEEPSSRFVTGVRPAVDGEAATFEADVGTFPEASYAAFGRLRVTALPGGAGSVALAGAVPIADEALLAGLRASLDAVSGYLGKTPDEGLLLLVIPGTHDVMRGKTLAGGGPSVLVRVGTRVDAEAFRDDWVVAHELVHVGFPRLGYEQAWFSEGLASYVEPVARARAGLISPERFWRDLVEGLPQGLPRAGDPGLAGTTDWGRVYWGGALYFLLADLSIQQETGGRRSLEDAVRGVASQANVESEWDVEKVVQVGDAATGTRVLRRLYATLARAPGATDLEALWLELGVLRRGSSIAFDDTAPLAGYRRAITAR